MTPQEYKEAQRIIKLKQPNKYGVKQIKATFTGYDYAVGFDTSRKITGIDLDEGGAILGRLLDGYTLRGFGGGCTYFWKD